MAFISSGPVLKRSTDGGYTWKALVNGLDNTSQFTSVTVSPSFGRDGTVFVAAAKDGIYRSTDRGDSWQKANVGLLTTNIDRVAASPGFGSGGKVLAATASGELYESLDAGNSWHRVTSFGARLTSLEFSPQFSVDQLVLAGDEWGRLFSSRDGGSTWSQKGVVPDGRPVMSIAISPAVRTDGTVFLGTYGHGLYVTRDMFGSIVPTGQGTVDPFVLDVALSPTFATDGTAWASGKDQAVFVSRDGGTTWELRNTGIEHIEQGELSAHHYRILAVSESYALDRNVLLAAFEGLFKSTDGGETWHELETIPTSALKALAVSPNYAADGTVLLSTYGGGTYVSRDRGATWQARNVGLGGNYTYDVALSPGFAQDRSAFTVYQGAFCRSPDSALTWQCVSIDASGDIYPTRIAPSPAFVTDRQIFLGTRTHGVYKSVDAGATWQPALLGMDRIRSIVLSPGYLQDSTVFVGTKGVGVLRSTDGGASWALSLSVSNAYVAVSPDYSHDRTVFAGTAEGVYRSADGGGSWIEVGEGEPPLPDGVVQAIAISPGYATDGTVFVGVRGRGLFLSTDRGASWTSIGPGLLEANFDLADLVLSPNFVNDRTLFGGTGAEHGELLVSTDGGGTWQLVRRLVRYENNNPALIAQGAGWTERFSSKHFSGSSVIDSEGRGEALHLQFVGSAVTWVGPKSPKHGLADVTLDGVWVGRVDQYAAAPMTGVALLTVGGLDPSSPHVVTITVLGAKNPRSGGHVSLDALDVSP